MNTIRADEAFLASLHRQRIFPENAHIPMLCWITPRVPLAIETLIRNTGYTKKLRAGEYVFGPNDCYDALVYLKDGLGGRAFGSEFTQPANAIALSIPGRIIGGNHCFFSGHPGVGRYFLLTEGEVIYAPRQRILEAIRRDASLFEQFAAYLDQLFQCDRLGFGAIALLPVQARLLHWLLAWGFTFGDLETEAGETRLVFEPMLSVNLLSRVVSANPSQVKRDLQMLKQSGVLQKKGRSVYVEPSALDSVWLWLRDSEERAAVYRRPVDWRPYITRYPKGLVPVVR